MLIPTSSDFRFFIFLFNFLFAFFLAIALVCFLNKNNFRIAEKLQEWYKNRPIPLALLPDC